ncbi:hypothetical protein Tco_0190163 [Tanacetum coccineum]
MHEDFEYVKSLEKEIDELESEKADFSNIYDLLLEECVSKDVICSYLHSLSDLNAHTELQCLYLHKVKECECLAIKLSKQTESVNKEVHNNLLKSFSKLEKHSISLELALQQCKEHMKNNSVCKENGSNVFRKEREQYHEIQDLKAQMQDKNIAISELKKLIENCKGKSVETQFDKPSVVRQPNAQRIPKPSVLGKPTPFSNSPEMRSFQTKQSVNKTNVSDGSNDMVHNYYLEKAKKSAQLQKDKEVNRKPSMIDPARLPNTANVSNWKATQLLHGKVENEPPYVQIVDIPNIHHANKLLDFNAGTSFNGQKQQRIDLNADALYNAKQENLRVWPRSSMFKRRLIAADQASVFMEMTDCSHPVSASVLHPMTSIRTEQTRYITTRVGITIPPSYSNAEDNSHKVVRLGINPMIQPEPEDLPKDNPKLEIAVLRMKKKCMDKGSKERSPPHNLRQKPGQYICCQNHKLIADIENDIMDPVMQCTTLPSHSSFSQKKLVSFVTEIHTLSIDISFRDR